MVKIELTNGKTYEVDHNQLPEFFERHQGEIVEYKKKTQPRRRNKKAETTKTR